MKLSELGKKYDNLVGRRDQVVKDLEAVQVKATEIATELQEYESALLVLNESAKRTQSQLKYVIEPPVNQALAGVFDNPYEFELRFESKQGRTWARQIFIRDGNEYKDLTFSGGGGPVDVSAFALQVAGLCLTQLRRFLMLDEPLKHLKSRDKSLEERGALMIQEISHKVGIQVLMISHIPEQQKGADKVFALTLKNGITKEIE